MSLLPMSEDCVGTVGNTPLVKLKSVTKGLTATIAVKLEYFNPTCSVKDRAALSMIATAEEEGKLTPGKSVIVEGTSGNMGIALAALCNQKGYKCVLVMPSNLSMERRASVRSLGATLILCDPARGYEGVIEAVERVAGVIPNSYKTNQFSNTANPGAHYKTTGPEIWEQTDKKVDMVVFGIGTGGTVTGIGRFLREKNPNVGVYGMEPFESSVINKFPKGAHKIQGIGGGFIPDGLDRTILNELAKRPENEGKLIVTTVNSHGERYLSTELFGEVMKEVSQLTTMSDEEQVAAVKKAFNC